MNLAKASKKKNIAARCVLIGCALTAYASTSLCASTLLISQVRTRGPNGATDEFIEIYNASGQDINLAGVSLYYASSMTNIKLAEISSGTLHSGCRYLFASTGFADITPDATYTGSIADTGGVALYDVNQNYFDAVGFSVTTEDLEGTPLTPDTTNTDQGYERKPGDALGNWVDSNDNAADFVAISPTTPRNAGAPCAATDQIYANGFDVTP